MAEEKKKGYWFTTETGKHVYVEEGQTPKEATEKALANAKSTGESKKAKELGIHKDSMKKVSESEMSDKEFEISEALSDFSWQVTEEDTADSFAESVANKLGYSKDEVLAVMKKENPKLTPETKIANIVSGENDDKLKAYQFPELTKEDMAKAKEYGLSYKAQFKNGDMVLTGTQQQLEDFANDYLAYELVDDYLTNDEDFDYEDLAEQGELKMVENEQNEAMLEKQKNKSKETDKKAKFEEAMQYVLSHPEAKKAVNEMLKDGTEYDDAVIFAYEDDLKHQKEKGLNNNEDAELDKRFAEKDELIKKYKKMGHSNDETILKAEKDMQIRENENGEYDRLQKIVDERIKQGWDQKGTHDPQSIQDTGYLGYGSLETLEKATFKNEQNEQNEKNEDDDFVPMEYYEPSEQQKAYGLSKYDVRAAVDEYNKTKGGRLIPHEETIKDLKQDIDWDLYNNEEELEKGIDAILGGKYLTDDEKQQVRDYFKQKNPPIETKKYDEVENKKVKKVASTIDAEIAKSLPRLYRDGFAGTQLSKDGEYNVLTFYAELGYDGMEKIMDKLDAKLKEMGIDAYFEMETSGRAIAYFK